MALICQIYHLSSAWPPYKQADSHLHTLVLCPITPPPAALNILKDFTLLRAACLILSLVPCPSTSQLSFSAVTKCDKSRNSVSAKCYNGIVYKAPLYPDRFLHFSTYHSVVCSEVFVHEISVSSPIQYKWMEFLLWFSQN